MLASMQHTLHHPISNTGKVRQINHRSHSSLQQLYLHTKSNSKLLFTVSSVCDDYWISIYTCVFDTGRQQFVGGIIYRIRFPIRNTRKNLRFFTCVVACCVHTARSVASGRLIPRWADAGNRIKVNTKLSF